MTSLIGRHPVEVLKGSPDQISDLAVSTPLAIVPVCSSLQMPGISPNAASTPGSPGWWACFGVNAVYGVVSGDEGAIRGADRFDVHHGQALFEGWHPHVFPRDATHTGPVAADVVPLGEVGHGWLVSRARDSPVRLRARRHGPHPHVAGAAHGAHLG